MAVINASNRWSYNELLRRAEIAAQGDLGLGLQPENRVIVQIPNIAGFLPAVSGLFLTGLAPGQASISAVRVVSDRG